MNLTGKQFERLRDALLNAFTDRADLAEFVRFKLNEDLDTITDQSNRRTVTFELIGWTESRGRTAELVQKALADRPGNDALAAIAAELGVVPPDGSQAMAQPIAWFVDAFCTPGADQPDPAGQSADERRWRKAATDYRARLLRTHNRLRVFGKDHDDTLDDIFITVRLLETLTARRLFDIHALHEEGADLAALRQSLHLHRDEPVKGMGLVQAGQNLYILGKPGAGKSTFMKWVTVQAAQGTLPRVPIFVSLHEHALSGHENSRDGLLSFVVEQFTDCGVADAAPWVEALLAIGQAIVLFDGLDEVRQEEDQRLNLVHALRRFTRRYDRCQYLITCRIAASEYEFEGFQNVEVADFSPEQVLAYASKWFGGESHTFALFQKELEKRENKPIAELCNSPLLLSMLCLDFDLSVRFPPNRAELYERALDALLRQWDGKRGIQRDVIYRELSPARKEEMFSRIAYPAFLENRYFFRERELAAGLADYMADLPGHHSECDVDARDIAGLDILKAIEEQHSIFVERAHHIYSFSHLTFHEYFTARYVVDNREGGILTALVQKHLLDDRWREVILLTVSMLPRRSAQTFITQMRHRIDELVADDERVVALLAWAQKRALAAHTFRRISIRTSSDIYHSSQRTRPSDCTATCICALSV